MKLARSSLNLRWTVAALILANWATFAFAGQKDNPPASQLPPEIQNAKIYKFPDKTQPGVPVESPVIYKAIAYDDVKADRLLLNLSLSIRPVDRSATIQKIYFQDVRVGGLPVHIDTFESEFKVSKKDVVDLPAPLKCTIVFSDLESLAPLSQFVNQKQVQITGDSFIEVKLNALQKLAVGGKQVVLPVKLNENIPLQFLPDNPVLQMAAAKVLEMLSDPQTTAAIQMVKDHLARLTAERSLSSLGNSSLYLIYCEYSLRNPQTNAEEKFVQSGTGFVVSADGKLLTAKRVIQPWKFDPQVAFLIKHFHLELNDKSYKVSAWPAGAPVLTLDGKLNFQLARSTDQQNLKVLLTAPDQMKEQEYKDPDTGAAEKLSLGVEGEEDLATLQLTGGSFVPLTFVDAGTQPSPDAQTALLSFPYGLSQPLAAPKLTFVKATGSGSVLTLDQPLNTGDSGAPILTPEGKVLAIAGSANQCISVAALPKLTM
ncbi:MAG TPA: trypsin-like peptidase domain-containing protein [Terriglobia bacterium]|nr:trypsin-like peptidase domain-containing protein [Terriglobia bacterium]